MCIFTNEPNDVVKFMNDRIDLLLQRIAYLETILNENGVEYDQATNK